MIGFAVESFIKFNNINENVTGILTCGIVHCYYDRSKEGLFRPVDLRFDMQHIQNRNSNRIDAPIYNQRFYSPQVNQIDNTKYFAVIPCVRYPFFVTHQKTKRHPARLFHNYLILLFPRHIQNLSLH